MKKIEEQAKPDRLFCSYGMEKYRINGSAQWCGKDINLVFTGGTIPHVGAVSVAVYEPVRESATVSTITVYEHRDDRLSYRCAKAAAATLHCTAVVSVGIHIDDAREEELQLLAQNFEICYGHLIEKIRQISE